MHPLLRCALVLTCPLAAACGDEFKTPSAYDGVVDLCADTAAFERERAACGDGCGGVASFSGTLQGRPVHVSTTLSGAEFTFLSVRGAAAALDRIEGLGRSPYFAVALQLKSIGVGDGPRRTLPGAAAEDHLHDDIIDFQLRASSAGESKGFDAIAGGSADLVQTDGELSVHFDVKFSAGDALSGCAVFIETNRVTRSEN